MYSVEKNKRESGIKAEDKVWNEIYVNEQPIMMQRPQHYEGNSTSFYFSLLNHYYPN